MHANSSCMVVPLCWSFCLTCQLDLAVLIHDLPACGFWLAETSSGEEAYSPVPCWIGIRDTQFHAVCPACLSAHTQISDVPHSLKGLIWLKLERSKAWTILYGDIVIISYLFQDSEYISHRFCERRVYWTLQGNPGAWERELQSARCEWGATCSVHSCWDLEPSVFFLIKRPILEDSGNHAFAKCETTVKYQHFSWSSVSHHAGRRNAKGVDLMRACPKADRRVKSGRYSILVLNQDNLKVISGKKCWILFKSQRGLVGMLLERSFALFLSSSRSTLPQ